MNIKQKFETLTQKEVIQLYLIVIMLYSAIYIFYNDLVPMVYPQKSDTTSKVKLHKDNKNNTKKLTDLELFTYFNQNSKEYNIVISETKVLHNVIDINIVGEYTNIIKFMSKITRNFKIKEFEMKKLNNKITVSIRLDRQIFYIFNNSDFNIEKSSNPFILQIEKKEYKVSEIIINAIIDGEILVDNSWYKKGDRIKEYFVLKIKKNEVILLNTITKKKIIKSVNYE